ncbi:hypothetical protein ElyMa_002596800 [Elysia marginata]|uniref:Uncharacterized protein n=1 Tax=Elysia marginata TaxID=1093978 RepID=A0AAV4H257_9GAST|nr:hypothetical protein ElyMa_002596800 [Elysia marginata]
MALLKDYCAHMQNVSLLDVVLPEKNNLQARTPQGHTLSELYVYRDAYFHPEMTVIEWRQNIIDSRLAGGPPYGKITCWNDVHEAMLTWKKRLELLPKDTSPIKVYQCAPIRALDFLGW